LVLPPAPIAEIAGVAPSAPALPNPQPAANPTSGVRPAAPAPARPVSRAEEEADVRRRVLEAINQYRGENGLRPYVLNTQLSAAAQAHTQDMADHHFCRDVGSDGSLLEDRIKASGYSALRIRQNVACDLCFPADVVDTWMRHSLFGNRNITDPRA